MHSARREAVVQQMRVEAGVGATHAIVTELVIFNEWDEDCVIAICVLAAAAQISETCSAACRQLPR